MDPLTLLLTALIVLVGYWLALAILGGLLWLLCKRQGDRAEN